MTEGGGTYKKLLLTFRFCNRKYFNSLEGFAAKQMGQGCRQTKDYNFLKLGWYFFTIKLHGCGNQKYPLGDVKDR